MEVLIVVLLVALLLAVALGLSRRAQPDGAAAAAVQMSLQAIGEKLKTLDELKTRLEVGDRTQLGMAQRLDEAQKGIEALRTQAEERRRAQDEMLSTTRRIESVFYGSASRGKAGENVLAEALRALPADMVLQNVSIKGKPVEFGLVMADGRCLPIDSKWPSAGLLVRLDDCGESDRAGLVREVQKEVEKRVREVAQYIDPDCTTPYAVAALPDAALAVCSTAYAEAHRRHVLLMSYSMAVPYLLALYRLQMQYSQTVDLENLKSRLADIGRGLDEMDEMLENRVARGTTMLDNFYGEARRVISRLRGSLITLQTLAPGDEPPVLPAGAEAD